jgi:hypothetical protein
VTEEQERALRINTTVLAIMVMMVLLAIGLFALAANNPPPSPPSRCSYDPCLV